MAFTFTVEKRAKSGRVVEMSTVVDQTYRAAAKRVARTRGYKIAWLHVIRPRFPNNVVFYSVKGGVVAYEGYVNPRPSA